MIKLLMYKHKKTVVSRTTSKEKTKLHNRANTVQAVAGGLSREALDAGKQMADLLFSLDAPQHTHIRRELAGALIRGRRRTSNSLPVRKRYITYKKSISRRLRTQMGNTGSM